MTEAWELSDERRLLAIAEADLFPGVPEPSFEPYARIVARLLDVPVALVSIVDDQQQFFPAQVGVGEPWASRGGTPLSMSFCQHVVRGDAPLVVVDATGDDRVRGNLAIEELEVIAYLGVPVRAPGGEPLGSVCAIAHHPRQWTDEELAVVEEVADAIAQLVAVRTSDHRWARFAAHAAHRLRTPVAALRLELEDLAAWTSLSDDARAALGSAAERAADLGAVVEDLSRLAAVHEQVGQRPVVVVEVVRSALGAAGFDTPVVGDPKLTASTSASVLRASLDDLLRALSAAGATSASAAVETAEGSARIAILGDGIDGTILIPDEVRERVVQGLRGRIAAAAAPAAGFELVIPA